MFPDDTGIAFAKNDDLLHKLHTYDKIATRNHLMVNWGKVFVIPHTQQKHHKHNKPSPTSIQQH